MFQLFDNELASVFIVQGCNIDQLDLKAFVGHIFALQDQKCNVHWIFTVQTFGIHHTSTPRYHIVHPYHNTRPEIGEKRIKILEFGQKYSFLATAKNLEEYAVDCTCFFALF